MIHFDGRRREEAKSIAKIEDMSHLMVVLAQFDLEEYNEENLEKKDDGILLILDSITFVDPSYYSIPAMLPMYFVNVSKEGSDEEAKNMSEDSNRKEKNKKKDKKNKKNIKYK